MKVILFPPLVTVPRKQQKSFAYFTEMDAILGSRPMAQGKPSFSSMHIAGNGDDDDDADGGGDDEEHM